MSRPTLLSWSSGKDSAWALHLLRQCPGVEVVGLFTTVSEVRQRVTMHGVRLELLLQQADAAQLPLYQLGIPDPCSNECYEVVMRGFIAQSRARGIECMAFGDLFLEDIRKYREAGLKDTGIVPLFPLWGRASDELIGEMQRGGLRAYITCVDTRQLSAHFLGRELDRALLAEFPASTDPCGENGEFHTFVFAGPMFRKSIDVGIGETIEREGFVFADLLPKT
jgi:uncharacterized protein (TIGR00290 family)